MKKTSYFTFSKLNPSTQDEDNVGKFCRETLSFSIYSIEDVRSDLSLMEGAIVFSKKITIWEASSILKGMTVSFLDDFNELATEIAAKENVRIYNRHPAVAIKFNLLPYFDDGTVVEESFDETIDTKSSFRSRPNTEMW